MFFYGKIHYKSPFSIAMLNYRRVVGQHLKKNCRSTSHRDKIRERLKVSAPSRKNTIFHGVGASCTSIVLFLVGHIYIYRFILCPDNQTCILPSPSPIRPISLALGNLIRVMPSVRPWLTISSKMSLACRAGTFSRVPSVRWGILLAHGTPGSRAIALHCQVRWVHMW